MSVERFVEAERPNNIRQFPVKDEEFKSKQLENKILEFPLRRRVWVERGLEWERFKINDLYHNRPWIDRVLNVVDTAVHEMGHVYILRGGGTVISATVIPSSTYQGLTVGIPNSRERRLMSLVGGLAAEEADGQEDHRGCGSDLYHFEVESQMYGLSRSEASLRARSEIGGQIVYLQREALGLAINGTIAA